MLCERSFRLHSCGLVLRIGDPTGDLMADLPKNAVHELPQLRMPGTGLRDCKLFEPVLMSATIERWRIQLSFN